MLIRESKERQSRVLFTGDVPDKEEEDAQGRFSKKNAELKSKIVAYKN